MATDDCQDCGALNYGRQEKQGNNRKHQVKAERRKLAKLATKSRRKNRKGK